MHITGLSMLTQIAKTLAAVSLALLLSCAAMAQTAPLPLTETFSDDSATDGNPVTWRPGLNPAADRPVIAGSYYLNSNGPLTTSYVDGLSIANASMTTTVRLDPAGGFQWVGMFLRSSSVGAYWGGIDTNGEISVGTYHYSSGSIVSFGGSGSPLDVVQMDVDLEFSAIGNQLSLTAWSDAAGIPKPSSPQMTFDNTEFSGGELGLAYNPNGQSGVAIYGHVSVVPEPSSISLLAIAAMAFGLWIRRRVACERLVA
jgi:hypothetical protein